MNNEYSSLFLIVSVLVLLMHPVFAYVPHEGDTKITGADGETIKDITIDKDKGLKLEACISLYVCNDPMGTKSDGWYPSVFRFLDFYIYKSNFDGSNGALVKSYRKVTMPITGIASYYPVYLEPGSYNLVIKYEGNLKHCNNTSKIVINA